MNSTDELRMQRADAVFALAPVIPVITIDDLEDALPMARALVDNGLKVLEVTLRTPVALDAIERIATEVPDACVGAGTVLDLVGLKASIRAGAHRRLAMGLKPGGWLLLEAFHPAQLAHRSGGPKDPDMLYTPEQLSADFAGLLTPVLDWQGETTLSEGPGHQGLAHVTRWVGQRAG